MKRILPLLIAAVVLAGGGWWLVQYLSATADPGTLYGNVDIRQVDLAFEVPGKVVAMAKREGDRVRQGEIIAEIDTANYQHAADLAAARRDAAKAQLDELLAGTRPEDVDQARANMAAARASLADARAGFLRQQDLAARNVSSQQQLDDARMAQDSAVAKLAQTQAALTEAINGPRPQDIEAGRANFHAAEAELELARTQLAHTKLVAPCDGIVMTRVIEPGTVVLPGAAVYSVAIQDEVWVRAFAPEPLLPRLAPGTAVTVAIDGGHLYRGRIGYLSPQAEFTPKTVETPELRTQLVYRLRVRVENPDAGLRQGMPVTLHLAEAN
ncbi:MAG TPA: HlyD family efflux transporter periplasmic adaptor subunit [Acetobacteraceae bacterium]|nr:HlyD family efflux transporter periplasmic adaptor subunit [Acetobacteraceae bacterium]